MRLYPAMQSLAKTLLLTSLFFLFYLSPLLIAAQSEKKQILNKIDSLEEVVIYSSVLKTTKISKNGLSEMDLPQAISILDTKTLQAQQINSLSDVLKNVNGIYIMGTTGGYQEEIASRGSNISSTNTFKNGIRFFNGMKIEVSGIEKIEVVKGNTAIEYGNVAPGGILNMVTKKPKAEWGGGIDFTYASFDNYKPQIDIFGPINKQKTIRFRLNGAYQQGNSFRKYVQANSYYFNPSILFVIAKKSTLLLEGDFTQSRTVPDFGAGAINYKLVDIPRDRFTGVSWGQFNAQQSFVSAKYTTQLSSKTQLNVLLGHRNYATALFSNTRPNSSGSIVLSNGDWKRNLQQSKVRDNYFLQQVDINLRFNTGKIIHQILIGMDAEQSNTLTTAFNNFLNYDQINIFLPYNPAAEPTIPTLTLNTLTKNPIQRYGIYLQDLIAFSQQLKLLVGARYNYIQNKADVYTYATKTNLVTETVDKPLSPKIGLIFQPSKRHTIFASYSNSFILNTGVNIAGNPLKPSIIDQYEIGIKNKIFAEKLQFNLTAYQINNNDLAQTSFVNGNTNTNIKELTGATQSNGVEIDLVCKPNKNLQVLSGYSYSQTKYVKSNIYIVGSELRYNPKHTANLSINYEFTQGRLKNLNFGVINQYFGERFAGRSTRLTVANDSYALIPLNAYFMIDCILGYRYKNWKISTKLANILNQLSYNIHDDNSLNPIPPTNFSVQIGLSF